MPTTTGTLFFNPSSGAKLPEEEQQALQAACRDAGLEVIRLTKDIDCGQTIRERMSRGVRLFVAAGGDGTVSNVVQQLVNSDARLAVLPVGTYNHFARDLDIPLDWREALAVALEGNTRQIDAARVNERFFVNNLSLGLYPELVALREAHGRDYPRWKARLYAAFATLKKYPHVTLAIETAHHQEVVRTHVFMVSNNPYELSGIGIEAARSTLEEGRLAVYWLPKLSRLQLMKFTAHYLTGRVWSTPGFRSFRTAAMKVQSARAVLKVGVDGEVLTLAVPLTITIVPQSLLVKVR
ncbi:MAG TPA: diacylglycerol kinase family protein [Thermoanaerobaculia bacterium]|nr:diacylglycerol kinase family protein [Thermoanaerobaculia bacterium]